MIEKSNSSKEFSERNSLSHRMLSLLKSILVSSLLLYAVVLLQNILHLKLFNEQQKCLISEKNSSQNVFVVVVVLVVAVSFHDEGIQGIHRVQTPMDNVLPLAPAGNNAKCFEVHHLFE